MTSRNTRRLLRAALVADGAGTWLAPGALLLEGASVVAAGAPEAIGRPEDAACVDLPDRAVVPPLVNAHAHLDLTHVGPAAGPPTSFVAWIDGIRARRSTTAAGIEASVRRGIELSRRGGTGLIGDIAGAGSPIPRAVQAAVGLPGVSFLEVFGIGRGQDRAIETLTRAVQRDDGGRGGGSREDVRLGVQPHAPYSCGPRVYAAAARLGVPVSTHLAETLEEVTWLRTGEGPLAAFLHRVGAWDETVEAPGAHPVDALAALLAAVPVLVAHLNYVDAECVARMAGWPLTVAYCPRASAYFGHPHDGHAPHRYAAMLDSGVNVALGTDGLPCLDTPERISVLDDMRFLARRDGTPAARLLAMATVNGARGLGFDTNLVSFAPGPVLGVLSLPVDRHGATFAAAGFLAGDDPPRWEVGPLAV